MLSGQGMNAGKRWKTTIGLISKINFARAAHFFLYISLPLFWTTRTWNFKKLLSYTLYGWNVILIPLHFFSMLLIFTLHWWPLAFLILSPSLQNFHVVLPTQKCLLCFLSLALNPCRLFFSLSFDGLPPTFSFSVFLVLYIPNLWTWPNLSKLTEYFRQHGYRNNFRFPVSSLLTLLLSLLYKRRVAIRFPAKITSSCIWVCLWYICGADGQSRDYHFFSDG